jgi:hypothetical protein
LYINLQRTPADAGINNIGKTITNLNNLLPKKLYLLQIYAMPNPIMKLKETTSITYAIFLPIAL